MAERKRPEKDGTDTEKGFGTGLRAQLEKRRESSDAHVHKAEVGPNVELRFELTARPREDSADDADMNELREELAAKGLHEGRADERELLWAAAMLHDIGTAVDYDDHHRHSRYLVLSAGLPGWSQRETVLIAQMVRYHRKGSPSLADFERLTEDGDEEILLRCAAVLRLAEQLERARDQEVKAAHIAVRDGSVDLTIEADEDVTIARWAAERTRDVFARAFGKELRVS